MIDDQVPAAVVDTLLRPLGIKTARLVSGGFSGAKVFCCQDATGRQFALRGWPRKVKRKRVEEVHRVMSAAHASGCEIVPPLVANEGDSRATYLQQRYWDVTHWMPGAPLPADAGPDEIKRGAAAIARFHQAVRPLGCKVQPPPAAASRLQRIRELDRDLPAVKTNNPSFVSKDPRLTDAVSSACRLLWENWTEVADQIVRSLTRHQQAEVETQYVLRDVHREHILFDRSRPSGLIDFDAVRIDTPMTDLARWVGSFSASDDEQTWQQALAGYLEHSPSSDQRGFSHLSAAETLNAPADRLRLARDLGFATNWISLANWVIWIIVEKRAFPGGPGAVATRIAELLRSCNSGNLGRLRKH